MAIIGSVLGSHASFTAGVVVWGTGAPAAVLAVPAVVVAAM